MHVTIFSHEADIVRAKIIDVPDGEAFLDLTLTTVADLHQDQVFIDLAVAREIAKAIEAYDQGVAHDAVMEEMNREYNESHPSEPAYVDVDPGLSESMRVKF